MPRYIDADLAHKMLLRGYEIDNVPSSDVVEVVRCKDCKFYLPQENGIGVCGIHDYGTEPNDFCSFAEQREGERE